MTTVDAVANRQSLQDARRWASRPVRLAVVTAVVVALAGCGAQGLLGGTDAVRAQPVPPPGGMGPNSAAPLGVPAQTEASTAAAAPPPAPRRTSESKPAPGPTARPASYDARFVEDVTLPDHSTAAPGASVVKTWRVTNTGNTAWTARDTLVAEQMAGVDAPERVPLPAAAPGATVTISVTVQLPTKPGAVEARWRLEADDTPFGPPLWLSVDVQSSRSTPATAHAPSSPKPVAHATAIPKPVTSPTTYTVRRGDTLYSVARRFHLAPAELARTNHLDDPEHLLVGQVLRVPQWSAPVATTKP